MITTQEAKEFVNLRTAGFRKDMTICLTGVRRQYLFGGKLRHAYFPGLMTCLSYWEFLARMMAGKAKGADATEQIKRFAECYMDAQYTDRMIYLLWAMFRHKLAHFAHPYFIYDTQDTRSGQRQRIAWTISEKSADRHLKLVRAKGKPKSAPASYDVEYNRMLFISLPQFRDHLLTASKNYVADLGTPRAPVDRIDRALRKMFAMD